ncbi:MAG: hydroxyethylthiazole kinase [Methylobacteriaceae bacterium]|jgi:hydroxyethylthiazole kinase|nr:hydroxyethylthiazole kinase [Methylobacteriaceae bacterium]
MDHPLTSREFNENLKQLPGVVRRRRPLVHCITNQVAANFTANVLLALGASPAMVRAPEEVEEFVPRADALLSNLGTLDAVQALAVERAVAAAGRVGKPWVLDPITAGLSFRLECVRRLMTHRPAAIRGNASEILALAAVIDERPVDPAALRGVDSTERPEHAVDAAKALARQAGVATAVSGAVNYVTDGERLLEIPGGHPVMEQVSGVGCALNAVIAACVTVADSPFDALAAGLKIFSVAGAAAGKTAPGPGSFSALFLDYLSTLDTLP